MLRLQQTLVFATLILLIGCDNSRRPQPSLESIRIGELARPKIQGESDNQLLKTINFGIWIFEIPAENILALDDVWKMLYRKPLRFNDYDAFTANSFRVGFGQVSMWNKIREVLDIVDARRIDNATFLLFDGKSDELVVAKLLQKQSVFYISNKSVEGKTLGPGEITLRIRAEKIPGSRGVCNVFVMPVFIPPKMSLIPQLQARAEYKELVFNSVGFDLKMSPGDFVLLGPAKYSSHQRTLDSLFFSRTKPKPVVLIYLITCTGIID